MKRVFFALLGVFFLMTPGLAVNPDEQLANPALEERARDISKGIRCLVCQNENIDDSNAELARDLRLLIRERLTKGDDDDQVRQYLVDRFGEFVLLQPRLSWHTLTLWLATPAIFLIGLFVLWRNGRRLTDMPHSELSEEEKQALSDLKAPDR